MPRYRWSGPYSGKEKITQKIWLKKFKIWLKWKLKHWVQTPHRHKQKSLENIYIQLCTKNLNISATYRNVYSTELKPVRMKIWRKNINGKSVFRKRWFKVPTKAKILSVKSDIHITSEIDAARRHPADAAKIGMFVSYSVILGRPSSDSPLRILLAHFPAGILSVD